MLARLHLATSVIAPQMASGYGGGSNIGDFWRFLCGSQRNSWPLHNLRLYSLSSPLGTGANAAALRCC